MLTRERGLDVKFNTYRVGGYYFFIPFGKLEKYITEAFFSYCMTDGKTTVHRSEHLRVDKYVSFIPILVFI